MERRKRKKERKTGFSYSLSLTFVTLVSFLAPLAAWSNGVTSVTTEPLVFFLFLILPPNRQTHTHKTKSDSSSPTICWNSTTMVIYTSRQLAFLFFAEPKFYHAHPKETGKPSNYATAGNNTRIIMQSSFHLHRACHSSVWSGLFSFAIHALDSQYE